MRELLKPIEHLLHLHSCEQEGMQSGMPSPQEWITSVEEAQTALTQIKAQMENQTAPGPMIYKAMAQIMEEINAIAKDQKNTQQSFNFRGIDDVYNAIHPLFKKQGIISTTKVLDSKREDRPNAKSGTIGIWTILHVQFTYWAPDGSSITSETKGEGMDYGDKSSNKAMSAAQKYSLIQMFLIPTKEGNIDGDKTSPELGDQTELQKLLDEILRFTDPNVLATWANSLPEWHKNKQFVEGVQNQIAKLNKKP